MKFKIGDSVKIKWARCGEFKISDCRTLRHFSGNALYSYHLKNDFGNVGNFNEDELELFQPKQKHHPLTSIFK